MAGRGPIPKDPSKLAGHGARKRREGAMTILPTRPYEQPALPEAMPDGRPWPEPTLAWWRNWASDPLATDFQGPDWAFLMDTALLHAALWGDGDTRVAGELRLRLSKMGVTPEDRARLRITYASADAAEERAEQSGATARARRRQIKVLSPDEIGGTL